MGVSAKGRRKGDRSVLEPPRRRPLNPRLLLLPIAAIAIGGVFWVAFHPAADAAPRDAQSLLRHCTVGNATNEACVQRDLEAVLRADGQKVAFDVLSQVSKSPSLAGRDHALAHHLGRTAYQLAGDPAAALAACPGTMGSGCTHGVVEAFLDDKGTDASVLGLCQATAGVHAAHQCWHGVGHGLEMASGYDWQAAVAHCAIVPTALDRVNCASGVFMENIVGDPAEMDDMPDMVPTTPRLHAEDLLYPCRLVNGTEAAIGCWQVQPWAVMQLANGSFERAFLACSQAGAASLMCEEGVGQVAGARSRVTGAPVLSFCATAGNRTAWLHCMMGAVKDLINNANDISPGMAVCAAATSDYALECYGAVGLMHAALEPRAEVRLVNCAAVAQAYRYACAAVAAPTH